MCKQNDDDLMYILYDKNTGIKYDIRQGEQIYYTKGTFSPNTIWSDYYATIDDMCERIRQMAEDGNIDDLMKMHEAKSITPVINIANKEGTTAMHLSASGGLKTMCRYLISIGASIHIKDENGRTPLHMACINGYKETIQYLIEMKANVNEADNDLNTPLHFVSMNGHADSLNYLLSIKANLFLKNKSGKVPHELSKTKEVEECFKIYIPELDAIKSSIIKDIEKIDKKYEENIIKVPLITVNDFIYYQRLGKGSFGEVYLVKKKANQKFYAMKVLDKQQVRKSNLARYAFTERNVMASEYSPFICALEFCFQNKDKLFLIMKYCPGYSRYIEET
jgi:Protein kinase domain/Ankyrin repeats (3 copies)/Ankyrin repeat